VSLLEPMQRDASQRLKGLLTPDDTATRCAAVVTRIGKPAQEILAYARERGVGIIVMGKDGHGSGTAAASIGSVAYAVAREARCPVLLVPATSD
jgi:nucleotide-binding universal stress UspA family protein